MISNMLVNNMIFGSISLATVKTSAGSPHVDTIVAWLIAGDIEMYLCFATAVYLHALL